MARLSLRTEALASPDRFSFAHRRFLGAALGVWLVGCAAVVPPDPRQRAAMLVSKREPEAAALVLREHLAEHPDAVAERRLLIRVLGIAGDLGAAAREAELLARRLGPTAPAPWIELGHAYELAHRYDEALALYDRAAEVAPRDPAGPREGGMRAAHWGEVELAEPRLVEALRRSARDAEVWHALGLVKARLGDREGARAAYSAGLKADPRALSNRLGLATLAVLERRPADALSHYDIIIHSRPKMADAYLGRSLALIELHRYDDADQALKQAARLGANARALHAQRALLARRRSTMQSH